MDNTPLSTFPPALARLLLCGGGGLPAAWGPLQPSGSDSAQPFTLWHGDPRGPLAMSPDRYTFVPLEMPSSWALPLDPASPWPARMAVVAAWMVWTATSPRILINPPTFDMRAASVDRVHDEWETGDVIGLTRFAHRGPLPSAFTWRWSVRSGRCWNHAPALPTLPTHLAQHPPEVALLPSLYDVPEIKARVEALQ